MDKEERREQILECAKKLFAEHGYYNTQISDIIRDARIARGTFYRYFTNKKDIFVTLLDDYYHQWALEVSLEAKQINLQTISPEDYFCHRVSHSLLFFANDRYLCKIALRTGLGLPKDMKEAINRLENRIVELIRRDLLLGINNGHIRADIDVTLTANLVVGAILRASYFYFALGQYDQVHLDIKTITGEIAKIFFPGLFLKYQQQIESKQSTA